MSTNHTDRFDLWLSRTQRLVWLTLGTAVGVYETFFTHTPQPILLGFAVACLGLPIARALDRRLNE